MGLAALAALAILAGLSGSAWGHATLRGADPPMGSRLPVPPPSIRLWFDEPVVPEVNSLRILDRSGKVVQSGPLKITDAERLAAEYVLGRLEPGAYTVAWKVLSAVDGHVTRGGFAFAYAPPGFEGAVGNPAALGTPSGDGSAWTWGLRALRVAAVWAHLLCLLTVAGTCVIWLAVVRPLRAASDVPAEEPSFPAALARVIFRGALVSSLAGILALQLEWLQVSDAPWRQTLQVLVFFPAIPVALGTRSSIAAFVRLALLTGIASLATRLRHRDPIALPGILLLAAGCLLSVSMASHSAATGGLWWAVPDFLHLAAAALWLGGLILLARIALTPAGDRGSGLARQRDGGLADIPLREAMRRFTPWAASSVGLLVITGVASGTLQIPTWTALWRTLYGSTLATKVMLLLPLLGLALLNTLWCRGRLSGRGSGGGGRGSVGAQVWAWGERRFRRRDWAVRGEVVLAGAAVLCAAALTQLPPPKESAFERPPPITLQGRADGLALAITITSPQGLLGPSRVALSLLDLQGQAPPADARVILRPEMVEHEMRVLPSTAKPRDGGWYDGEVFFSMLGSWELQVVVRRRGQEDAIARFALNLGDFGFAQIDPARQRGTRLSLEAAWAGQSTRRQLLIGGALALGASVLAGLGAWRRRWIEVAVAMGLLGVGVLYAYPALRIDTTPASLRANPVRADAKSVDRGRALFQENCATCHGGGGKPSLQELPATLRLYAVNLDLTADHMAQHTDGDIFWWIGRGIPGTPMPGFGESLSEEERWHLVNYIRSLRARTGLRTQD